MKKQMFRRLKNLWKLSEMKVEERTENGVPQVVIKKDFPTVQRKLATIIPDERADIFEEEIKEI